MKKPGENSIKIKASLKSRGKEPGFFNIQIKNMCYKTHIKFNINL